MSDLELIREDVVRVRRIADRKRDEWEGDKEAEVSVYTLLGFIDVLLGDATLDWFLRDQDMDD